MTSSVGSINLDQLKSQERKNLTDKTRASRFASSGLDLSDSNGSESEYKIGKLFLSLDKTTDDTQLKMATDSLKVAIKSMKAEMECVEEKITALEASLDAAVVEHLSSFSAEVTATQTTTTTTPEIKEEAPSHPYSYNKKVFCDAVSANVKGVDDVRNMAQLDISEKIASVSDAADSLSKEQKVFNFIVISGHGAPSIQGLGNGTNNRYVPNKDLSAEHIDDIRESVLTIQRCLVTDKKPLPVFFLAGCEVGRDTSLIKKLSALMKNVLVVASEDALTYKTCPDSSVVVYKLSKGKRSNDPINFKFALNNKLISMKSLQSRTGHDPIILEGELTRFENRGS